MVQAMILQYCKSHGFVSISCSNPSEFRRLYHPDIYGVDQPKAQTHETAKPTSDPASGLPRDYPSMIPTISISLVNQADNILKQGIIGISM